MNNKLLLHILATLICILSLTACNRADEWEATGGDTGLLVTLTDGTNGVETRATPQELREQLGEEFLQQFRLTITHLAGEKEVYDYPYDGELIRLPAGFYDVEAKFGDNPILALDAPYYTGQTEDVEVKGHQQKSVSIACSVANALLSVKYENVDKLNEKFTNYYVSVHVGEESVDIKDTKQSAYFRASTTSLQLFFHYNNGQSQPITSDAIPATFKAGDHLILTLRMSPTMTMEVVKAEVKSVTVEETIPQEWLPKPKIEATGFTDNQLSFAETEKKEASLRLNTALPLQDLKLSFQFEDEQFSSLNDKEYLLSNPTDRATVQQTLDITLPAIGDTDAEVDLAPLIAKMQTKAGETVTNTLTLDVLANGRWSSEDKEANRTYTMVCNKPEFSIAVQPGNVWTKQFTIDEVTVTTGDAETIKKGLRYQYKAEGSEEWVNSDQLLVSWSEAPATKKYKVRAVYRGEISTNIADVELETAMQIPNSDMEGWQENRLGDITVTTSSFPFFTKVYYYDFLPYSSGTSDIWWATNNERSRDYTVARVKVTSSPCVSYSENEKHGGSRSALMYTSGHGGGYASTSSIIYPEGAFAGSLFIGNYSWSDKQEHITEGHSFEVRPTQLKFWYKYVPKNTDAFRAYIDIKNGNDIIGSGTFEPVASSSDSGWQEGTITLEYTNLTQKATSIYVRFSSTNKASFSKDDFDTNKSITFPVMGDWNAHIGSMLYIDDISLIYDK